LDESDGAHGPYAGVDEVTDPLPNGVRVLPGLDQRPT